MWFKKKASSSTIKYKKRIAKKRTPEQKKRAKEKEYKKRKHFCTTKSGKRIPYFNKDTGISISKFICCKDPTEKSKIFEEELKKPFMTLASNLIFVYKASELDDITNLRDDCVRFMYMKMETYDPKRPEKAFSYFNIVARNWLFQQHNLFKRSEKRFSSIDETQTNNYLREKSKSNYDEDAHAFFDKDFILFLSENFDVIKDYCVERDAKVLGGIVYLLQHIEDIDIYNRKAALLYLRDMLNMTPKQISLSLGRLKKIYFELKKKWVKENS
jgi:hypothetical protein